MAISRISDGQMFGFLTERVGRQQVSINELEEQIASGKRFASADQDPLGASHVVRLDGSIAALGQYAESSRFGTDALGAQDDALGQAGSILVRAQEIATQQASGLIGPDERVAAEQEVQGLLEGLTQLANSEQGGRRIFGGLALDAPPPFADPPADLTTYDPTTAYSGSTQDFFVKVGSGATERVRLSTRGDAVFESSLQALHDLWTALHTNGNVAGTLAGLAQGRGDLAAERASVGARQAQLLDRTTQVSSLTTQQQKALSTVQDADLATVITQLTQAQTALQATLAAGAQLAQMSLVDLLHI
jgi:flagellar hook-associated protein 3 FlgL